MRCRFRLRNRFQTESNFMLRNALRATPQSVVVPQAELPDSCLAAARAGAGLGSHREPIQYRAPASQPSEGKPRRMFAAGCLKGTLRPVRVVRPVLNPPADTICGCGVSPAQRGSRGHPPCSSFFFKFFFLRRKKNGQALVQS